ncbi:acyl-coenzyme A synthetase/AMP-(fatty) acid ligase [Chromobacterium alkanivorans]|uniref:AMP-binding protein n=1 Tax=Chromobacterium alkanivorans TaxID=1071719 RepID=UPI001966CEB8|nr:AMP-binding protein [Chromobacterium alkanivorans]MBN3002811.1 AMP-binding protein [Chromobacterium alkanivorans]MCS3802508.1 acyl-coenzyme A synthetase/AMP-(fatty) acid ligase [Chromobacterium alkanivorans]MCS3816834.1 acyl-coenzyme A synthetase/AMP-(fatty) acid ligase [Chromobacterium alkanivorans]MCS3871874.1 acyl-coenzyme A synthetase/AMP-(fatty) acid ligase [Chromobacterium alkanivorans]
MTTQSLIETLAGAFAQHAARPLFESEEGDVVSYAEVLTLARPSLANELSRRLVFCLCENDIGGLAGYFHLLCVDAVPLMLAANLPSQQLQPLLDAYRPAFIWLPASRLAEFPGAKAVFAYRDYRLIAHEEADYRVHDELALLLSTSGSTGSPKFVRLSRRNVLSNATAIAQYLALNADEVPITTLAPSYTYGLSILHSHALAGGKVAVTRKTFFERGFWSFLQAVRASSFGGVPYHYEMLKKLRFTGMELPCLRTLTQAGGRMAPELSREFALHCQSRGMRFFTMYGQTEATARMSYLAADKAALKAGSIGAAVPGGAFWLEDESGGKLEGAEAEGELVYQGPNVSMGYASGFKDLALGDERKGVLRTGDVARRDGDGDYYIVGRLKRFLKLFGHRINLQEVEQYLLDAGHVAACAGADDRLEVYVPQGDAALAKEIKIMLARYLTVTPQSVKVMAAGNLPRNASGKIQYSELTPQAWEIQA